MVQKRKLITKLFDNKMDIHRYGDNLGFIALTINNQEIHITLENYNIFEEFLDLAREMADDYLGKWWRTKEENGKGWDFYTLSRSLSFSDNGAKLTFSYCDRNQKDYINVDFSQYNILKSSYTIRREDFFNNILDFMEKNLEVYNERCWYEVWRDDFPLNTSPLFLISNKSRREFLLRKKIKSDNNEGTTYLGGENDRWTIGLRDKGHYSLFHPLETNKFVAMKRGIKQMFQDSEKVFEWLKHRKQRNKWEKEHGKK